MSSPLNGIRVIDITEALAGPYCTMLLGDLGADVIKVERPGTGDQSRSWGARLPEGESAYFCSTNRNKRSLTLDIQSPQGQTVLQRLLASADILVCNIPRLESLKRVGLEPGQVRQSFPRLIYVSISGYGQTGPYAGRSGYDLVAQGEAGLMTITGTPESAPLRYPIPLSDMTSSLYSVIGITSALLVREKTGQGQLLDISLLESQAAWLTTVAGDYFATGQAPQPLGNQHPSIVPYQVFHTADKDIIVAVGSDRQWVQLCEVIHLDAATRESPNYASNQARLAHRNELVAIVQAALRACEAGYWLNQLRSAGIPCGPINSIPEILADPHYVERGNIVEFDHAVGRLKSIGNPVRLSETPATYRLPPPRLGEHTTAILAELGYDSTQIEQLLKAGAV